MTTSSETKGSNGATARREPVDVLIRAGHVVTMNLRRDIIRHGAVAVRGSEIVAVGKEADLAARYEAAHVTGGDRFVATPGMVNSHIHITGEPLTRGYVPDDITFEENVFGWLCPLYASYTAADERLSAQLAATEMLRSGTTCFLEAGTVRFLDDVVDGLVEIGIRGRVGRWVWDIPPEPDVYRQNTDEAIANLQAVLERHGSVAGGRIAGHVVLVGHNTASDPLWRAARELASEAGVGFSFHMSPAQMDPDSFLAEFGQRPIVHLAELGVLDTDVAITHCVHLDDGEVGILAETGASVAHCPTDGAEGRLRRHAGRQDARDDGRRCERVHRNRRQQRLQLLRPDAGHVPRGGHLQGRPLRSADVPRRDGLRNGNPRRRPLRAGCR